MSAPPASAGEARVPAVRPRLGRSVRVGLLVLAAGLTTIFGIAAWLNPYDASGRPLQAGTHRQLGLPPCTFYYFTGYPCPSCGMTTSFALLVHGDVPGSLHANAVGTLLALFWLALIPWAVASAARGRPLFVRSMETALLRSLIVFLVLVLGRWAVVLALAFWHRPA